MPPGPWPTSRPVFDVLPKDVFPELAPDQEERFPIVLVTDEVASGPVVVTYDDVDQITIAAGILAYIRLPPRDPGEDQLAQLVDDSVVRPPRRVWRFGIASPGTLTLAAAESRALRSSSAHARGARKRAWNHARSKPRAARMAA